MAETLEVDPMSAASPDLAPDDVKALTESIRTLGQLVPIVLYRGKIIDGRKRLAACTRLGIVPQTVRIADEATAEEYATALNLLRTHYTHGQRSMYAATLAKLMHGTNQHVPKEDGPIQTSSRPRRSADAAALVGVNRSDVQEAKRVRREAAPEVTRAVERGDLTLHAATRILRTLPREQQAEKVARVIETKGTSRRAKPGSITAGPSYKALPKRAARVVLARTLTTLETMGTVLEQHMECPLSEVPDDAPHTLDWVLIKIRRFRRRLGKEAV